MLETFGTRIRKAIQEGRGEEVMYHVGRPGHDFIMERTLQAWGIDGHNSHTNVCSSSARLGYLLWHYADRPSPDHANARFILLLSAHLESGHYFNPHAQRIIDGKMAGAKLAVMDPRLSNTASMADYWMPTYPGTEAAVLLAMAKVILDENRFDATFVKNWTNWEELEVDGFKAKGQSFEALIEALKKHYAKFTPQFAEKESGVKAEVIVKTAREIATAGSRFASHLWRGSASGNLGGWQPARALMLLHVLTGSVGTEGGHNLNAWNKFVPKTFKVPPPQKRWNELLYPQEWPLCTHEMSFLLPHFLKEGRGRIEAYFTRVFNPVWTYPDGFSWIEMLRDEEKVGLHAALDSHVERDRMVRRLRSAHGIQLGAARLDEPGIVCRKMDWFSPACESRAARKKRERNSSTPIRRIPARCGKRTSSGSTCRGRSIRMDRWAFGNISNRRTGRGRS